MDGSNVVFTHFTAAGLVVVTMNWLKNASWFPLVQKDAVKLNRAFSMALALAVGIGIRYVWTPGTEGTHILTLTIPSWSVLAAGLWHSIGQYLMQEGFFQVTKARTP
jgi:hypothetical protein